MRRKEIRKAVHALHHQTRAASEEYRPGRLNKAWEDFFDLSETPRFNEECTATADTSIEPVLEALSRSLLRGNRMQHLVQFKHMDTGLMHGAAMLDGCITTYFWFPADDLGMAAVHRNDGSISFAVLQALPLTTVRPVPTQASM